MKGTVAYANRVHHAGYIAGIGAIIAWTCVLMAQYIGGMAPCPLCHIERIPYAIMLMVFVGDWVYPGPRHIPTIVYTALWTMACAAGVIHVGVEHHWWPSPLAACGYHPHAAMVLEDIHPCDQPIYPWHAVPISFALANTVWATLGTIATLYTSISTRRRTPIRTEPSHDPFLP